MEAIVSSQAAAARMGVVCLSRMVAAFWCWLNTRIPIATLISLPKASIPSLSSSLSFSLCTPLCQGSTVSGYLHSAVRLKHHRARADTLLGWGYCSPSGYCCFEGNGLPEHDGCCCLGYDSAQGSPHLFSQFFPTSFGP